VTDPYQHNCPHSESGWCLDCVQKEHAHQDRMEGAYRAMNTLYEIRDREIGALCAAKGEGKHAIAIQHVARELMDIATTLLCHYKMIVDGWGVTREVSQEAVDLEDRMCATFTKMTGLTLPAITKEAIE